jgi:integrase
MASILRLRFLKSYVDQHGRVRHYVRRPGHKLVPLPGLPGSPEFLAAYSIALDTAPNATTEIGASRTRAGSINAMIVGYTSSANFHRLAPATQEQYLRIFERLRREHGDRSIATLQRKHVVLMVDARAKTPVGARDFLRCLRLLTQYAISIGVREDDPTAGVRVKLPKSDGIPTWGEEEIARFEAAYAIGTKPRLALELLLATAARRSDAIRLSRTHVRADLIHMKQQKTGKPLQIPVTDTLAAAISAAAPSDHLVFLLNENNRPFTPGGFTKWFRKQCTRIGLTGSPHGLRKASCRRMAEAGCSAHEIASVSGHMSLKEVQRYCDTADQARMAQRAAERVKAARDRTATAIVSPRG